MKLLAIETSSQACSVALFCDGEVVEKYKVAPREHHALLLPMIKQCFAETSLTLDSMDAIVFGRGPGSFTGLRIAAALTQGLAIRHDIGVIPISTLQCLAQMAYEKTKAHRVIACLDARMNEVYWAQAHCQKGIMKILSEEYCTSPEQLNIPEDRVWSGIGEGWQAYPSLIAKQKFLVNVDTETLPRARILAVLAAKTFNKNQCLPPEKALPLYLRDMRYREK